MNVTGVVLHPTSSDELDKFLRAPSHAVLLVGPSGCGKTHIAATLAARLLSVPTINTSAYAQIVQPEKGSITIGQIRQLVNFFRLRVPGTATIRRTAIIEDADVMGIEAQNALLKLLEEPPADSVLVLTSSHSQSLLPTIRSRTQVIQLASPSSAMLTDYFISLGFEKSRIAAALLRAGTNIAEAAQLLTSDQGSIDSSVDLAKKALGGTSYDRLLLVDTLSKQREKAVEFVDTLATIAMVSLEASAKKGSATLARWQTVLSAAHSAQDALSQSGNAKLILTELMLAM